MDKRSYSRLDQLLIQVERGLKTLCTEMHNRRPNPAEGLPEPILTEQQRCRSGQLMRVNHAGEVCAQALYFGQMTTARSPVVYKILAAAAEEETDHLAWTAQRLKELQSHRSYLNLYWYLQSYLIGLIAGLAGDRWSLGFIEETEQQVTRHLESHLHQLTLADTKSRKIISQMRNDEEHHGKTASESGARQLPKIIKWFMAQQAKILTTLAQWI